MNVKSLLTDTQEAYNAHNSVAAKLSEKWEKTGLLTNLTENYKNNMAVMLENQAKQLITEASATGGAGQEEWSGVALPLVRRIFSAIAAKDFVSVQPMQYPSGLVFYLDMKYGTAQPGFTTSAGATSQADSIYGVTSTVNAERSGGLYGAGRFGYSMNDQLATTLTATVASASWTDVKFDATLSASFSADPNAFKTVTIEMTGSLAGADLKGVRAFKLEGANVKAYYPTFTTNITGSSVTWVISGSHSTTLYSASYYVQPTASNRGDFEYTGTDLQIPELNVSLRSEPIVAKTRKLKAVWTPEFAQDLNNYHNIDAEVELTGILSEYISMEIDLEILDMLIQNAATTDYWSAKIGTIMYDATTAPYFNTEDNATGRTLAYTQPTWYQTLGTKIQKLSNKIHAKTMRGGANFMVMSPEIATIVESMQGYGSDTDGDKFQFAMGVQKAGVLFNRFQTYKNPYMLENNVLIGFRGTQFLECGAVYAPYIPLIMTPLIYDPVNFVPRKGVITRYAKKVVRPEFYANLKITHTNYI